MARVCVILGAGASYDIANEGAYVINEQLRPPLASHLFHVKDRAAYYGILQRYPDADYLASNLAPLVEEGAIGVEEALRRLANSVEPNIQRKFGQIPMYLRDLIFETTKPSGYITSPAAYENLLTSLFYRGPVELLFIVMNYDDLLERAVTNFNKDVAFNRLNTYMSNSIKVLKPHGSVNWWKPLPGVQENWKEVVAARWQTPVGSSNNIVVKEFEKSSDAYQDYQILYPLITAPLSEKSMSDFVAPKDHQNQAQNFLSDCRKFLIVGSSGFDTDLMSFLNDTTGPMQPVIHFVGSGGIETQEAARRYRKSVAAFHDLNQGSEGVRIEDNGFAAYLKSTLIGDLLES